MTVNSFKELMRHVGHEIICTTYDDDDVINVVIECETCYEILFEFEKDGE